MSSIVDTPYSTLPQPKSGWQLFKSLTSGSLTPGLAWQNPAYRRKFMLRSLATPFTTARLLGNLSKQPRLMQILRVQPGLPCRLHRPWLTINMGRQNTLDALNDHYQMMSRHLPASLLNGYLSSQGITLVTLTGKEEQQFSVRLSADAFLDKEGEATLTVANTRARQRSSSAECRGRKRMSRTSTFSWRPKPVTDCSQNVCWLKRS